MDSLLRYAGQIALYALFAAFIGYFSVSPRYRHLQADEALLRLSFSHSGKITVDCRQRTPEELAKLPANMRAPLDCQRERSPVVARVELDGAELVHETFAPSGLSRDGASALYERIVVGAGEQRIAVRVNDDARRSGFAYQREQTVQLAPAQVLVIDFDAEAGGITLQ